MNGWSLVKVYMAPGVLALWLLLAAAGATSDLIVALFMTLLLIAAFVGEHERSRQRGRRG